MTFSNLNVNVNVALFCPQGVTLVVWRPIAMETQIGVLVFVSYRRAFHKPNTIPVFQKLAVRM
jgi:hypothetical protein